MYGAEEVAEIERDIDARVDRFGVECEGTYARVREAEEVEEGAVSGGGPMIAPSSTSSLPPRESGREQS